METNAADGGKGKSVLMTEGRSRKSRISNNNNYKMLKGKNPLHTITDQNPAPMMPTQAQANVTRRAAGSNWQAARDNAAVATTTTTLPSIAAESACAVATKPKPTDCSTPEQKKSNGENDVPAGTETPLSKSAIHRQKRKAAQNKYVAMDCEMVGVGPNGANDMLARVSIVNKKGDVLLDKYVKVDTEVTDYRTSVSGIRPQDIENGDEFLAVQDEVLLLLQGKILVGHGIRKDLEVLHIKHPFVNIRDTSRYKPLRKLVANGRTPSLKHLSKAILNIDIQTGEHNSVEDARATMNIYKRLSTDWEHYLNAQDKNKRRGGK